MTTDASAIRTRLFNVVPAASFQLERMLSLVDVVLTDAVSSAAVECSRTPRMLLNPQFLERYCQSDGHLLMLVLHELQHVILGHTRLFPRATWANNLAFDAVINAMLCRQFPSEADFFRNTNGWDTFPARLLRPAPGWPHEPQPLPADASDGERRVHALLYGNRQQQVTYHEVFKLLVTELKQRDAHADLDAAGQTGPGSSGGSQQGPVDSEGGDKGAGDSGGGGKSNGGGDGGGNISGQSGNGEVVLLGDHGGTRGEGQFDEAAVRDETFQAVLRRIVEGWPPPDQRLAGRDTGRDQPGWTLDATATPEATLRRAVKRLLARAGVTAGTARGRRRRMNETTPTVVHTVVPQGRDRRAHAWHRLYGSAPVLWRGSTATVRRLNRPNPVPHVYLDVSGSMHAALPPLAAVLRKPVRDDALRLFVFSTVVDEARPGDLSGQRFENTGGTDIRCVLTHLAAMPARERPRRVVLLTDGYVGSVDPGVLELLHVSLYVGHYPIFGPQSLNDLKGVATFVEVLPVLPPAPNPSR